MSAESTAPRAIADEALNSAIAFLGKTGSGKTTAAKGAVERILEQSRRVCVLDPTGVWWGLRLSGDGLKPSGLNIVIFGGDHADVPLTPDAGERLATLIASGAVPQAIIDLSDFSGGEITKFATEFFSTLFRLNRTPLHLVLDEADTFAPQNAFPDQRRMQGAIDKIARQGRVKGFRLMLITQRPQKIDKSVVAQIATLIAMKLTLPHDRKAVGEWLKGTASEDISKSVLEELPSLPTGSGIVWYSDQETLSRVNFPRIQTFDSSRAPEIGDQPVEPMPLDRLDLAAIRAQLDVPSGDKDAKSAPRVTVPDTAQLDAAYRRGFEEGVTYERNRVLSLIAAPAPPPSVPVAATITPTAKPVAKVAKPPSPDGLHTAGQRLLEALAQHAPARWTWRQLGILAGLKASGGHFNSGRKSLRDAGFIVEDGDLVSITDTGITAAGVVPAAPSTVIERLNMWCEKLPSPAPDILRALAQVGVWISVDMLAEKIGKKPSGGHWNSGIAVLRNNRLIEVSGRDVRLAGIFCDLTLGKATDQ